MAKIKYTKTEQKNQQDALKQFQRFLPTLQLKKQQLQQEVRQSVERVEANREAMKALSVKLAALFKFFGDSSEAEFFASKVEICQVIAGSANIAGITIPVFEKVEFAPLQWDLLDTPWHADECIAALKEMISLRAAGKILEKQYALLLAELVTTTQRVNLFEKIKIPECKENIRRIRIYMSDQETSAVARSKIAKKKGEVING
ncbi:MAG: V-type ATP synthase subunit D [Lentisphaerae bacterium]|jgi:V/A-type H+-transporting ATPase subunit D|nr:V-type ATP synthase subunit D [Lentisphaerota bacterium]